MCPCLSLYVNSQHIGSILQEEIVFVLSAGWVMFRTLFFFQSSHSVQTNTAEQASRIRQRVQQGYPAQQLSVRLSFRFLPWSSSQRFGSYIFIKLKGWSVMFGHTSIVILLIFVLGGVGINLIGTSNHNLVTLHVANMPIQEHRGFSSLTRIGTLGLFALNSHRKSNIHHILVVMISSQWRAAIGRFHTLPWISRDLRAFSDGQKRPVFIYRLLTAGTIDGEFTFYQGQDLKFNKASEKIYQRQVTKLALSDCMFSLLSSFLILSSLICVALIGSVRFSFVKLFGALNMLQRL